MSDNHEKLMDLLQVLSARYPADTDIGDAYQLAGELSCSEEGLAERLSEQEANWKLLAETMRGYSDTAGDHHWQAAEALELLVTMRQLFLPLLNWKREALAVEAEWDVQAVGKLCDVPLGQSIRPAIEPTLIALKKRIAELEALEAVGAVMLIELSPARGVRGQIVGMDGSGQFAEVHFGDPEECENRCIENLRAIERGPARVKRAFVLKHSETETLFGSPVKVFRPAAILRDANHLRDATKMVSDDSELLDDLERVAREYMTGFSVVYKGRCDDEPGGFVAMRRRYQTEPLPTLREAARRLLDGGVE